MRELSSSDVLALSERFGDAFYLLDTDQFEKNFDQLSHEFRTIYPHFNIAYSYKTNYTPRLCRRINELGGYAEVVSEMELDVALRVGVDPSRIIWNGPIKNPERVRDLLLAGGTVNIDSLYELNTIRTVAADHPEQMISVGIRCNFDVGDGTVSRFGFDVDGEDFDEILGFIHETPNIHLMNLQCHFAKRDVKYWPARAEGMLRVADRVSSRLGYMPERLDIGGGIYGHMPEFLQKQLADHIPSYEDYAHAAALPFRRHFPNCEPELVIEPGSAMVGDCMRFVGRVKSVKTVRGKTFITMMGSQKNISMNHINPPMRVIHASSDTPIHFENADIVGYTCIEGDVLYHGFTGDLAVGDFLEFSNCGSYSVVMKPPFILPNFPVLDICSGQVEIIKEAECMDDLFHTFHFD